MKHKLNIFHYSNYREFLGDLYRHKKRNSKRFSHRVFVRVCGFSSPNFLKLVMDGKRNLGKGAREKLISAVCSNKLEREYLNALILFDQSKCVDEKNKHLLTISRIRHRRKVKNMDVGQYEYLSKWYNVAIRELVSLENFSEDPKWINKKLKTRLSDKTIKNSIEKLVSLGFLKRDDSGRLRQTDAAIICDPKIFSMAVSGYHREMIDKGKESIDSSKSHHRDITGLTFGMDRKTFERIKQKIKLFREEIHHLASSAEAQDVVYQINFQLFNLTEVTWEK